MRAPTTIDVLRVRREGRPGIERRQQERLQDLLTFVRSRSPLLRERYAGLPPCPVPLSDLPPLTKHELMADFDAWVTDPAVTRAGVEEFVADPARVGTAYRGTYFVCRSSGTTGVPGLFVHDSRAVGAYQAISHRINLAWLSPRDVLTLARRRVRWVAVVGTGGHYAGEGWMQWQRRRDPLRRRSFDIVPLQAPLSHRVGTLTTLDPAALTSYPSELNILAQEQQDGRLRIAPVLLEAGGETVVPVVRERIESAFGVRLRETYSSSEFLTIAHSCDDGWLHVNSDWVILEPVDAHGRPTPPGEASHTVLLTHLANTVQPLIRYDLGDSVMVREDACACGDPLPAIRVRGRSGDVLNMPGRHGRKVAVAALALATVAEQVDGLRRVQLLQTAPERLAVRLEVAPGALLADVWPTVRGRLTEYLTSQGVTTPTVELDPEPPRTNRTSGKLQQVVPLHGVE